MFKHMKLVLFAAFVMVSFLSQTPVSASGNVTQVEPKADKILKQMSNYLKSQQHFIAQAETSYESILDSGQKITYLNQVNIYLKRPDRLYVRRTGMIRNQDIFYDGNTLTLYSRNKHMYASAKVPPTLDQMFDYAIDELHLVAPGSDLLYSDVYQGLMSDVISGMYIGTNKVNGILCHHLAFRGKEVDWQLWVEAGNRPIPRKYVITSKWTAGSPEYSLTILSWDSEKAIPEGRFHFEPKEGDVKVVFLKPDEINGAKKRIRELRK